MSEERYWIVPEDDLGTWGDSRGSTKEEAEAILRDVMGEERLVIIRGVKITPRVLLPDEPAETLREAKLP